MLTTAVQILPHPPNVFFPAGIVKSSLIRSKTLGNTIFSVHENTLNLVFSFYLVQGSYIITQVPLLF